MSADKLIQEISTMADGDWAKKVNDLNSRDSDLLTSDANIAMYTVFLSDQSARRPVLPPLPCARAAAAAPIMAMPAFGDI